MRISAVDKNSNLPVKFGEIQNIRICGDLCGFKHEQKEIIKKALKNNKTIQKYISSRDVDLEIGMAPVITGFASVTEFSWIAITDAYKKVKGNPLKKLRNFLQYLKNHEGIYIFEKDDWGEKLVRTIKNISNEKNLMSYHRYNIPQFKKYLY